MTRQVTEMEDQQVVDAIECQMIRTVLSIMGGEGEPSRLAPALGSHALPAGFSYMVPSSSSSNTMYVKELDRIVLKDKVSERVFGNLSSVRSRPLPMRPPVHEARLSYAGRLRS